MRYSALICYAICAILLGGCTNGHPGFHGPQATPLWRMPNKGISPFLIRDGILYARVGTSLGAFDAKTGKEIWKSDLVVESIHEGSTALYVADKTSRLHALDAKSGSQLWESTVAVERVVYSLSSQLCVTAGKAVRFLDPKTGDEKTGDEMGAATTVPWSAVVVDDVAYTVAKDATIRAVTATQTLWTAQLPSADFQGPIVSGDNVYFYCLSAEDYKGCQTPSGGLIPDWGIYAYHRKTGELRWKWRPDGYRLRGVTVDPDRVYVSAWNESGAALVLDASTGQTKWSQPLKWQAKDWYFRRTYRAPLFFDPATVVFFDQSTGKASEYDEDHLENKALGTVARAYNRATGAKLWESKLPWKYEDWVLTKDGLMIANDWGPNSWRTIKYRHAPDSWLTVLDLRTGKELWRSEVWKFATLSSLVEGDGVVVFTTWPYREHTESRAEVVAFPTNRQAHR